MECKTWAGLDREVHRLRWIDLCLLIRNEQNVSLNLWRFVGLTLATCEREREREDREGERNEREDCKHANKRCLSFPRLSLAPSLLRMKRREGCSFPQLPALPGQSSYPQCDVDPRAACRSAAGGSGRRRERTKTPVWSAALTNGDS